MLASLLLHEAARPARRSMTREALGGHGPTRREDIAANLDCELDRHAEREGDRGRSTRKRANATWSLPAVRKRWPGNFRDLAASVTHMATFSPKGRIETPIEPSLPSSTAKTRAKARRTLNMFRHPRASDWSQRRARKQRTRMDPETSWRFAHSDKCAPRRRPGPATRIVKGVRSPSTAIATGSRAFAGEGFTCSTGTSSKTGSG